MDKETIQGKFRVRRAWQIVISLLALAAVGLVVYVNTQSESPLAPLTSLQVVLLALVFEAGMLVVSLVNWRCPDCNKYLGRGWNPKTCPKCKTQLR